MALHVRLAEVVIAALLGLAAIGCAPQLSAAHVDEPGILSRDSIKRQGYELVFINKDPALNSALRTRLIETFFAVYPRMVAEYNPASLTTVTFVVDPAYQGVATTDAGIVRFNPDWFHKHPKDIDVVTREVMHIVQAYPADAGPDWITEGIADYVRYQLGVDNAGAGWSLPALTSQHRYTDSDRVSARFLVWIEAKVASGWVKALDAAMRNGTYSSDLWAQKTGKSLDELWAAYVADPALR